MSTDQQNKEEEVDLGSLFTVIGNGLRSIVDFFVKIFVGLFHFLIEILLFIKGNLVKFLIAALIGGGIGAYFQLNKESLYGADMLVQPNFQSTKQLYNDVGYYNNLLREKDTALLAKTFNITKEEASKLRGFEVSPIKTDDDKIEKYFDIIDSYDTVATRNYSFDVFKKSFTDYDYKTHVIHVRSLDSRVFDKLGNRIISSIMENDYFNKVKNLTEKNLQRKDSLLKENLSQIDTLRKVYMQVMLEEAKKESNGTSIDVGATQNGRTTAREIELFQTNRIISNDLDKVTVDISEQSEVINVVSNFQKIGYPIGGLRQNSIVIYAVIAVFLMAVVLLLLKLNSYLDSYKK